MTEYQQFLFREDRSQRLMSHPVIKRVTYPRLKPWTCWVKPTGMPVRGRFGWLESIESALEVEGREKITLYRKLKARSLDIEIERLTAGKLRKALLESEDREVVVNGRYKIGQLMADSSHIKRWVRGYRLGVGGRWRQYKRLEEVIEVIKVMHCPQTGGGEEEFAS